MHGQLTAPEGQPQRRGAKSAVSQPLNYHLSQFYSWRRVRAGHFMFEGEKGREVLAFSDTAPKIHIFLKPQIPHGQQRRGRPFVVTCPTAAGNRVSAWLVLTSQDLLPAYTPSNPPHATHTLQLPLHPLLPDLPQWPKRTAAPLRVPALASC